jgi:hypothetical protein
VHIPTLLRFVVLLIGLAACAIASSQMAEAGHRQPLVWRADKLSPGVVDATGQHDFWKVSDAVAEWAGLDANINPVLVTGPNGDIIIAERANPYWLAKSQVLVQGGDVIRARILLNPTLRRAPYTRSMADHVLCHELGQVLGLRRASPGSCMSAHRLGRSTSPNALDEARLRRLYSTVASSVSTDPVVSPGAATWITLHTFSKRQPASNEFAMR